MLVVKVMMSKFILSPFDVGEHPYRHLSAALDHPEYRRLLLGELPSSPRPLQAVAPSGPAFF